MSRCPSREELQQLLAEQLSDALRRTIETHVEACAACQETLARLSDEGEAVDTQIWGPSAQAPLPESEADFVQHLKQHPPRPMDTTADAAKDEESSGIVFPGPPSEKGPLGQLGPFAIRKQLGAGSFGVVYQAYDDLDRLVALKVLKPELAAIAKQRALFEQDARRAAAVKDDHVVTIHQVGHTPEFGLPYFVMEHVDGEALSERLRRQGLFTPREAARIVGEVALALVAAHARAMVHRDIKPSNILLENGTGRVKLTDFGLARVTELDGPSTSQLGRIVGAPAYMSPEQIVSPDRVDGRSDVYSLGVVLYELLTGERPFRGLTHLVLQQVVHDEPRPPRKLNDHIPRDLETITLKCLTKEPERRYQTAAELAEDLERWSVGKPIHARPVGIVGKFVSWCRRNPSQAAVAVLAVIALMAVTAFSLSVYFIMRVNAEKQKKTSALELADRLSIQLALEGGLSQCEQGKIARGMFQWANSLKIAPDENLDFGRVIRGNLAAWSREISPLRAILTHKREVMAGAFTSDGKAILTASGREIQKWDPRTGTAIGPPVRYPGMIFALSPDGKTVLITMDIDRSAQLVEADTGKPLGPPLQHPLGLRAAAFSPDGSSVVTGGIDKSARLWQVATGKPLGPRLEHQKEVYAVAVGPDGKTVLTGSRDGTAQLWDGVAGQPLGSPLQHRKPVLAVAFSPDGKTVLTASEDKTAQVWDVPSRTAIGWPLQLAGKGTSLAFSPDGQMILTSEDNGCRLWKTASGKPLGPPLLHQGTVKRVCFSPDGKRILTTSADKTARLWETASATPAGLALPHGGSVSVALFSPDGKTLWTGSDDGTVRLWDIAAGHLLHSLEHRGKIQAIAISPDRKTIVTGSDDKTAKLWDVITGTARRSLEHDDRVLAVAFSPDGNEIVTGSANGTVRVWEVATGMLRLTLPQHRDLVFAVAFSPDGETLLSGSVDWTAQLWDARTGMAIVGPLQHQKWIFTAVFSPDGKSVLTASADGTARLWDTKSGQPICPPLHHFGMVYTAVFSPDGEIILTGSADGTAQIWDAHTGRRLGPPLQHQGPVRTVAFSADGRLILTGSDDKTAQLWDRATGKAFGPPLPHADLLNAVAFSPDGKMALTGGDDHFVRLWEVPVPMEAPQERIVSWLKVITGTDVGEDGSVRIMDTKTWQENRELLKKQADLPEGVFK